jgi:TonB family protein
LRLDPNVTGTVTLDVRNVTAGTVLRVICESIGCRWRVEAGTLHVERDPTAGAQGPGDRYAQVRVRDVYEDIPVRILWNDAPIDAALKTLARMLSAELSLDRTLSDKRITLIVNNDTPLTALNAICKQAGCISRLGEQTRRVLRVTAVPLPESASFGRLYTVSDFAPGLARPKDPGVTAPKLITPAIPQYTPAAMQAKIQGTVVIDCVVETDGTVGDVRIVRSLDKMYGLDYEAVEAAKLYLFEPGTRAGKPIPVVVVLNLTFSMR